MSLRPHCVRAKLLPPGAVVFSLKDKQERFKDEMLRYFSWRRWKLCAPVKRGSVTPQFKRGLWPHCVG